MGSGKAALDEARGTLHKVTHSGDTTLDWCIRNALWALCIGVFVDLGIYWLAIPLAIGLVFLANRP